MSSSMIRGQQRDESSSVIASVDGRHLEGGRGAFGIYPHATPGLTLAACHTNNISALNKHVVTFRCIADLTTLLLSPRCGSHHAAALTTLRFSPRCGSHHAAALTTLLLSYRATAVLSSCYCGSLITLCSQHAVVL